MAKTERYRKILIDYLQSIAADWRGAGEADLQVIADPKGDHYLLLWNSWTEKGHIHSVPLHFDIKGEKIWIQENLTELLLSDHLIEKGVPKSDIVLGVLPPEYRKYSEFAAA